YDMLGCEQVKQGALADALADMASMSVRQIPRTRLPSPDRELNRNQLWAVLSHLATHILEDRPDSRSEIIGHCYVTTQESTETDKEMKRLVKRPPAKIIRDAGGQVASPHRKKGISRTLEAAVKDRQAGVYVLTGGVGCGKTTFLSRFQHVVEPSLVERYCAWF